MDTVLNGQQTVLKSAVERVSLPQVRHPLRRAFQHIEKAWKIRELDPEMAVFRVITAEEEAATGVIHALKARAYLNADKLKHRSHLHKSAIWVFVEAVRRTLAELEPLPEMKASLKTDGEPRFELHIDLSKSTGSDEKFFATPDEPLNFAMRVEEGGTHHLNDLQAQLLDYAKSSGFKDIKHHLKETANLRNELLYASQDGVPKVEIKDGFILNRSKRVELLSSLAIMIVQTQKRQLFAAQCLKALLLALSLEEPARSM